MLIPLLSRTQAETPDAVLNAAELRLADAECLLANQQWDGVIYLAGYVVEFLLKAAFCKLLPGFPTGSEVKDAFGPADTLWRNLVPLNPRLSNKHDLFFWETVVNEQRRLLNMPRKDVNAWLMIPRCIDTVRRHWDVNLRYQPKLATVEEAREVCNAARILFDNRTALWS